MNIGIDHSDMGEGIENYERGAGILLHISSLPGAPYIGDIGQPAIAFAEFLHQSAQSVWQMLPINPTAATQGYSPYSSLSSMAGNPLLISMEALVRDGWLDRKDLQRTSSSAKVQFSRVGEYKQKLLRKAWKRWNKTSSPAEKTAFTDYCARQDYWLNSYALYTLLKQIHKDAPWFRWRSQYRDRDQAALQKLRDDYADEFDYIRWVQMIFDRQWQALKSFCSSLDISLLGDVPIYVAHDSADVWSHRGIFALNDEGMPAEIAGVPPDLFNADGQLWGMPVFNWNVLKETRYRWWVQRFRRNLQWFNLVRLDHFRGFSSYWSVPAGAKSAKTGKWIQGPGDHFFEIIEEELSGLPFVAEDLGEIDQPVYLLRDKFNLPGMNVLQFAFGEDMPASNYLPHQYTRNSIVYTGTHDNNTTVGWFNEASRTERNNLSQYIGGKINPRNVASAMIRLAYMSVAKLAIVPMQDVLSLDKSARMNMPASSEGNWAWRLLRNQLTTESSQQLKTWSFYYGRSK